MSAASLSVTSSPATDPPRGRPLRSVPGTGRGPRLLLPPTTEPVAEPLARELAAIVAPTLRSVRSPVTEGAWPVAARPPAGRPEPLPDPGALCGSIVLAAVEAIGGSRPLGQLTRWVTGAVLENLSRATADRAAAAEIRRPAAAATRTGAAVTRPTATSRATAPARRATVRSTRVCLVSPTTAEATVVVHDGARVRAAAIRLQVHRGQWRAVVLQIG